MKYYLIVENRLIREKQTTNMWMFGILKNIPQSVNNRLSSISANEDVFVQAIPPYQEALQKSGYDFKLQFAPKIPNQTKKQRRQRRITWFNPPFSQSIQTNIGELFLKLIDENFPPNHLLSEILNCNTVKVSYRCMPKLLTLPPKSVTFV